MKKKPLIPHLSSLIPFRYTRPMNQKIIDISRTLHETTAVWPGDIPYSLTPVMQIANGDSVVNVTRLNMSSHMATHMDAPYHFHDEGQKVHELDLSRYWGVAQLVTVHKAAGALLPEDFAHVDLRLAPRLLVRSRASGQDPTQFHHDYVYPSPALADFLGQQGIILYGADAPSMDASDSKTLDGHHALLRNDIMIVEGLDFTAVDKNGDGLYEFVALPLKLHNGDGSPIRAALKKI
jgi:arylformamidase